MAKKPKRAKELEKEMTEEQISEARASAEAWEPVSELGISELFFC